MRQTKDKRKHAKRERKTWNRKTNASMRKGGERDGTGRQLTWWLKDSGEALECVCQILASAKKRRVRMRQTKDQRKHAQRERKTWNGKTNASMHKGGERDGMGRELTWRLKD
eukprot:3308904-Rhodomonas_salina.1